MRTGAGGGGWAAHRLICTHAIFGTVLHAWCQPFPCVLSLLSPTHIPYSLPRRSLLVFHRPSNTLRHYDSSGGSGNAAAAKRLAAAVGPALQPPGAGGGGSGSSGSGSSGTGSSGASGGGPRFVEVVDTPRQCNGYDCGVYVLAVARAACERWCLGPAVAEGAAEGAAGAAAEAGAAGRGEDGEAGGEGSWREWERGLRALITPAAVKALRREVREVIREKAGE